MMRVCIKVCRRDESHRGWGEGMLEGCWSPGSLGFHFFQSLTYKLCDPGLISFSEDVDNSSTTSKGCCDDAMS